ncbi:MAG: hypothetical protein JSW00_00515 [Thermoplasmata archaeon]|nr:MAG: hypothetical protein JSW00_00515 [Thermoplasmata archaeon]
MGAYNRILVFTAVFILILSVIPMSLGEEGEGALAQWTFMVYLDCDNNLEQAGIEDINEMEAVGSTDDVNIIVQMDRCATDGYDESNGDWTGAKRFYVTKDEDENTIGSDEIEDLDEVNMGDPQTLVQFVKWTIDNYPAEKYALVLWNHGGAFWGVCWDEDDDEDCLTMPELKCALENIEDYLGRDLDLIGFDACLMAQMAVMYQIRNSVDYAVASGYTEPNDGWPYKKILPYLVSNPQMGPVELGTVIANEYVESYTDWESDPEDTLAITQAVFDLEKFDELAYQINFLSMVLSTKAGYAFEGGHNGQIWLARDDTNSYDYGTQYLPGNNAPIDPTGYCMYDVIHLMENLPEKILLDSEIRSAAEAVKTVANEAIVYFAVDEPHEQKGAHGLTIYFPDGEYTFYDGDFDELDFAQDIYWDDFLHYFHNTENAQDTPPGVFITTPVDDDVIDLGKNNKIRIQGTAFDVQDQVSLIEIKIDDGEWIPVGASTQWNHELSSSGLENGNHIIYARSFDGKEYSAEDSVEFSIIGSGSKSDETLSPLIILLLIVIAIAVLSGLFFYKKRKSS